LEAARADLRAGLSGVFSDVTPGRGYLGLEAGIAEAAGAFVGLEAGYRPTADTALFARAGVDAVSGWGALVGARWEF
jgi:hypothetical protein